MREKSGLKAIVVSSDGAAFAEKLAGLSEFLSAVEVYIPDKLGKGGSKPFSSAEFLSIIEGREPLMLFTDCIADCAEEFGEGAGSGDYAAVLLSGARYAGSGASLSESAANALSAAGIAVGDSRGVLFTVRDADKPRAFAAADAFRRMGYEIFATGGTKAYLSANGIITIGVKKLSEGSDQILKLLSAGRLSFVLNTPTDGGSTESDGHIIRARAAELGLPCLTDIAFAEALAVMQRLSQLGV